MELKLLCFVYKVSVWLIFSIQYEHMVVGSSCPCSSRGTSAVTDVAANVLISGNSTSQYCVIGAGFRSFRPLVASSLTYLPGTAAYLTVYAVLGYIFAYAGLQFLLQTQGCLRLTALSATDALVPGTSVSQRVLRDSTNFANAPYFAQANLIAASSTVTVPSSLSPLSGMTVYDFSNLSSFELMGISLSDFQRRFGNANVTTRYIPPAIVVQKKGSPPAGNAVGSTGAGAQELITQDLETVIFSALNGQAGGTCAIVTALTNELVLQQQLATASGSIVCSNNNILFRTRVNTPPDQMLTLSSPLLQGC